MRKGGSHGGGKGGGYHGGRGSATTETGLLVALLLLCLSIVAIADEQKKKEDLPAFTNLRLASPKVVSFEKVASVEMKSMLGNSDPLTAPKGEVIYIVTCEATIDGDQYGGFVVDAREFLAIYKDGGKPSFTHAVVGAGKGLEKILGWASGARDYRFGTPTKPEYKNRHQFRLVFFVPESAESFFVLMSVAVGEVKAAK